MVSWERVLGFCSLSRKVFACRLRCWEQHRGQGRNWEYSDLLETTPAMAKRKLLAFPCLNLLGHIFQCFSRPVEVGLSLLFNGICDSPPCESPSARNSSFTMVFEETGGCWPIQPDFPWVSSISDLFIAILRRFCASFHFLKTPDCAFSPIHGCHLDVSMKQKLAARSWTFKAGSTRSEGPCFSHTPVSSLPFSRIRMRQIPSVWFNPQYLILQESAGTHTSQ